tara:strand:- start:15 stop:395 length:381 start_codon:yes stop_codon:yes gene_type:complete
MESTGKKASQSNEIELTAKYIFDENYNPKYVNGAYGGVNPGGEIVINFYLERTGLPNKQVFAINDQGKGEELIEKREPLNLEQSVVRVVENGVILDLARAKDIRDWLGKQIAHLEELIVQSKIQKK